MAFGPSYAGIYDSLYNAKDYASEARFVLDRISRASPVLSLLDLGCGTGQHAIEFAKAGVAVTGVDASSPMLDAATLRISDHSSDLRRRIALQQGDVRTLDLGRTYDAVVSLFAVVSYMVTDRDLAAAFATARRHLLPGGQFLFDYWHGPAVVSAPPVARDREAIEGSRRIKRLTKPNWNSSRDVVEIEYQVEVSDMTTGETSASEERHNVRYFFEDKIRSALHDAGFMTIELREWYSGCALRADSFYAYALAEAV